MSERKTIIVTGAAGGVGTAIVDEFNRRGWVVIPLDQKLVAGAISGLESIDLARFVQISEYREHFTALLNDALSSDLDRLVLVNNAAVQVVGSAESLTLTDWEESLAVNVLAPFFLSQALFEKLQKYSGRVINIGSVHASLSKPGFAAYATTKGALTTLTKSLAVEWAPSGIAVNGISPAAIDTPMLREGFLGDASGLEKLSEYHPARKIATPQDVALLVQFLADFDSTFLTGSILDLSGGISSVLHDPT